MTDRAQDSELWLEKDYAQLRADLERAVHRVCPPWLGDRKDDLIQVALLRIMDLWRREGNREFSSFYLRRTAHSAMIDEIRRLRRQSEVPLEDESGEVPVATTKPGPDRDAKSREIGRGVGQCLGDLVLDRKLAVTLYLQGHSVPEASRLLEWGAKRTENLVYRGLADLRQCLEAKGLKP